MLINSWILLITLTGYQLVMRRNITLRVGFRTFSETIMRSYDIKILIPAKNNIPNDENTNQRLSRLREKRRHDAWGIYICSPHRIHWLTKPYDLFLLELDGKYCPVQLRTLRSEVTGTQWSLSSRAEYTSTWITLRGMIINKPCAKPREKSPQFPVTSRLKIWWKGRNRGKLLIIKPYLQTLCEVGIQVHLYVKWSTQIGWITSPSLYTEFKPRICIEESIKQPQVGEEPAPS